jgi:hypothetical protein
MHSRKQRNATKTLKIHRRVEQLVARRAHNPKVTGSSPVPATKQASLFRLAFFMHKFSGRNQKSLTFMRPSPFYFLVFFFAKN